MSSVNDENHDLIDEGSVVGMSIPNIPSSGIAIASQRASAEVQTAMFLAKRFPRDEAAALLKIERRCASPKLAEVASYEYSRGGTKIYGPSIRLAEVLAQYWGNLDFGWIELGRMRGQDGIGVSSIQAHCWDMETNTRRAMTFSVRHVRDSKEAGQTVLRDERDIYETIANAAARRMRACILAIVPGDIADRALERCEKALETGEKSLADRIKDMVTAFDAQGVTIKMIETKLGHSLDATTASEIVRFRKVYNSIKDGFGAVEAYFAVEEEAAPNATDPPKDLKEATERANKKKKPKEKEEVPLNSGNAPPAADPVAKPTEAPKPTEAAPTTAKPTADDAPPAVTVASEMQRVSQGILACTNKAGLTKFVDENLRGNGILPDQNIEFLQSVADSQLGNLPE